MVAPFSLAENSEICISSVEIQEKDLSTCQSLIISTYPEAPIPNESLEITINPNPNDWEGTYLIQADSGKFSLYEADSSAKGIGTSTLITSGNKIIYNGGQAGEKITVSALEEGNENWRRQSQTCL